jgi:hypothetical protein
MTVEDSKSEIVSSQLILNALELAESHIGWCWDQIEENTTLRRSGSAHVHRQICAAIEAGKAQGETREDRPVLVSCPVCGKMDPECDEPGKCPYGPNAAKGEIQLLRQWVKDRGETIERLRAEIRLLRAERAVRDDGNHPPS